MGCRGERGEGVCKTDLQKPVVGANVWIPQRIGPSVKSAKTMLQGMRACSQQCGGKRYLQPVRVAAVDEAREVSDHRRIAARGAGGSREPAMSFRM